MQYRRLGRTGLDVSVLSLGTGGPSRMGQARGATDAEIVGFVRSALELGINFIDTAPEYDHSESLLGRALSEAPRESYVLASKFRPDKNGHEVASPAELRASVTASLDRLGVETIDLLQFHGVTTETYRPVVDTLYATLEEMRTEGQIRFLGITEKPATDPDHQMLSMALEDDVFDTIMVGYSLVNQSAETGVIPRARATDVGVIGMVAVRRVDSWRDHVETMASRGQLPPELVGAQFPGPDVMERLLGSYGESLVSTGYKFVLGNPDVSTVLTGTSQAAHLEENIQAAVGPMLPEAVMERIRSVLGSETVPLAE